LLFLAPVAAIAITIGVSAFYDWLENSDFLRIEEIDVNGIEYITEEEVLSLVPGVVGENLLQLDPMRVAASLRTLHRIESVNIKKRPPGTLILDIHERIPVAALVLEGGRTSEIDITGTGLELVSSTQLTDLPVITGAAVVDLSAGDVATSAGAKCALGMLSYLLDSDSELISVISEIDVRDPVSPRLVLTNGSYVYLSGDYIEQGLIKLDAGYQLLDQLEVAFSSVDLRFSHRAVVIPDGEHQEKILTTLAEGSAR
jgi:cell division protein FtsQ